MMSLDTLLEHLDAGQPLVTGTEAFDCMHAYSYEAMRLTAELNSTFHTPDEIRAKIYASAAVSLSMPAAVSRIRAGSASVTGRSSGTG